MSYILFPAASLPLMFIVVYPLPRSILPPWSTWNKKKQLKISKKWMKKQQSTNRSNTKTKRWGRSTSKLRWNNEYKVSHEWEASKNTLTMLINLQKKRNGLKTWEFRSVDDKRGKQQSTDATTTHQQHPHLRWINLKRNYKKWILASTWTSPLVRRVVWWVSGKSLYYM